MFEIRIHGRGGKGVVTAAELLSAAAFAGGRHAQAFPSFGTAQFEARRCLSCGTCFECDNCYGVCPDNAVIKLGPGLRYQIDLDCCKGCGICAAECPCGAIEMLPERI
jgi:Pyruvate/2-oxoacid:ferredoxin oxidoreductase delta subunit